MMDPLDISYHENSTIKTELEDDSYLTNDMDNNIDDLALTELKQEPCEYREEIEREKIGGNVEQDFENCVDTRNIDEFMENDKDPLANNIENDPFADDIKNDTISSNIITKAKQIEKRKNSKGKKKNVKILVDSTVKFSVADIIVHCRGDPNLKPEHINLEQEYKNFKKCNNKKFSHFLGSVSKNSSCELKTSSGTDIDDLALTEIKQEPCEYREELGDKDNGEFEKPRININSIKEEVVDSVVRESKDSELTDDVCSKCANIQLRMKINKKQRLWYKSNTCEEYICKLCLQSYSSIKQLKVHLDTHGTQSQFKCQQCTLGFSCKACLSKHIDNNHESNTYTCHHCMKTYPNKMKLIKHMSVIHKGITYTCAICMKTFQTKPNLMYHIKLHDGDKYYCAQCPKFYNIKQSLIGHIFSQHYSKSLSSVRIRCPHCRLAFTKKYTLHKHIANRHNQRFPCKNCDKTFSTPVNLKAHMNAMHRGKRYTCPHCPEQFPYRQYLKHHVRVKHKGVVFECKLCCNKRFSTAGNLSKHMKGMHCEKKPIPKYLKDVIYG